MAHDELERVRAMGQLHRLQGLRDSEEWKLAGFMAIFHPELADDTPIEYPADEDPIFDEHGQYVDMQTARWRA